MIKLLPTIAQSLAGQYKMWSAKMFCISLLLTDKLE